MNMILDISKFTIIEFMVFTVSQNLQLSAICQILQLEYKFILSTYIN